MYNEPNRMSHIGEVHVNPCGRDARVWWRSFAPHDQFATCPLYCHLHVFEQERSSIIRFLQFDKGFRDLSLSSQWEIEPAQRRVPSL